MTIGDLSADHSPADDVCTALDEATFVLYGFALSEVLGLIAAVDAIVQQAAFRHMVTPGNFETSAALTSSGALGWISDRRGYRYATHDPFIGDSWPPLLDVFLRLAHSAAAEAGFHGFMPDACLINRYVSGARMSLHQDKDEQDYGVSIVSASLGVPTVFLFDGHHRANRPQHIPLFHGDAVVWGDPDCLRYHGIAPLKDHPHAVLGSQRINLTFRKAGWPPNLRMTTTADLSESAYRQAETFLATLGEDWARHVAAAGPCGHAAKPVREPYETLIRTIVYQQLHAKAGDAILGRFIAFYPTAAFPAPQQTLATDEAALRACGFSAIKLATIRGIAQAALDGIMPTREQVLAMPDEALIERLVTLRGVGRWTVEMLLIYTLERLDISPVGDFGVRDDYRRLKRLDATLTHRQMETISPVWSPYRIVVAWYLWRVPADTSGS